jgi:hypothetical protein
MKKLGNWGGMSTINNSTHITQTNSKANFGVGAHVSTCISGTQVKIRDYFDATGNHINSSFGRN